MQLKLQHADLLNTRADAILLAIDGSAVGLEGRIARVFASQHPEKWRIIQSQIDYPIALGEVAVATIPSTDEFRPWLVLLVSTLNHMESLTPTGHMAVIENAVRNALFVARSHDALSVSTGLLSGGWRMTAQATLTTMINAFFRVRMRQLVPILTIDILDAETFELCVSGVASKHYLKVARVGSVCEIERSL